jgi:hypothetical protein
MKLILISRMSAYLTFEISPYFFVAKIIELPFEHWNDLGSNYLRNAQRKFSSKIEFCRVHFQ